MEETTKYVLNYFLLPYFEDEIISQTYLYTLLFVQNLKLNSLLSCEDYAGERKHFINLQLGQTFHLTP